MRRRPGRRRRSALAARRLLGQILIDGSIIQMMGRKTIAEYVSDQHMLQNLKRIGVDFAQGYRVGKPRPLTA